MIRGELNYMYPHITRLFTLMIVCLMIIQILPAAAVAEELADELPAEESVGIVEDTSDGTAEEEPAEETEAIPDHPQAEDQPAETEPEAPVEEIESDDETEPEQVDVPDEDMSDPDDDADVPAQSEEPVQDPESNTVDSQEPEAFEPEDQEPVDEDDPVLSEETPDVTISEDSEEDEIDYEAIEADSDMEFDDVEESLPDMSEEEEVEALYDGSWIKYAIYNYGHTYVLTKGQIDVYDAPSLSTDTKCFTIRDRGAFLLAVEHCRQGNTNSVQVWFMTPDNEIASGYVLESDLVNEMYTDEMVMDVAGNHEHRETVVGGKPLNVFAVNGEAVESEGGQASEDDPDDPASDPGDDPEGDPEDDPDDQPIDDPDADPDEPDTPDTDPDDPEADPDDPEDNPDEGDDENPEGDEPLPDDPAGDGEDSEGQEDEPGSDSDPIPGSNAATGLTAGQKVTVLRGADLQKYVRASDGSATTATYRHLVRLSVNGTEKTFNAVCLNAKRSSSTSGFSGSLVRGKDYNPWDGKSMTAAQKAKADGMFWILMQTNFTDPFDTAIAQWAIWKYGGGTDYDSNVAKVSNLAAGKGFQYSTSTMRSKINSLVSGAQAFVSNGGVPTTAVTAELSEVTQTDDGHLLASVQLDSNGEKCRIAKSQLAGSLVTGYSSENSSYYYFDPSSSFTVDTASDSLNFDVDAWTKYDQYEYWVGNVSSSSRQDMGFIVYTGGIGATANVSFKAQPLAGQIQVKKTDALDRHPIAGVIFDIYQGETFIASMTTDDSGIAVSDSLPVGEYTVKEHNAPAGYINEHFTVDCSVNPDEITELRVMNMPIQFRIEIVKTDSLTNQPLPGAEFTIVRTSGLPSHGSDGIGEIVGVLVTDSEGKAVSELLTWGEYSIEETGVPNGYVDEHYTATAQMNE